MPRLRVDADANRGTVTVVVRGELDAVAVPALAAELAKIAEHEPRHLVFDLTGLCFIDCAAARLIAGSGRFLTPGRRPVIRGARPAVRRLLQVSGLDAHCDMEDAPGS